MALVARPTAVNFAKLEKRYGYQEVGSEAPLTTVWTEPASCVSAIPTISAGFCDSQSCSPYPDASIVSILSDAGASVDYPAFTTGQAQTSTDCMPSGYADLKLFYFTGGTQCPLSWSTATVTSDSYSKTIVCCPSGYPDILYIPDSYDCYKELSITAGQQFILEAQGEINVAAPTDATSWVPAWQSVSRIGTTAWPTPTNASVFHPGVNLLAPLPTSTLDSGSGSSNSTSSGPLFSLFALSMAGSIGVLVAIVVAALCGLGCLYSLIRRSSGRKRRAPVGPPAPIIVYQQAPMQYGEQPMAYQTKVPNVNNQAF